MASLPVTAIVLRRRPFGEADSIATLLTREIGKVDAIAKGARKPGSRCAGSCEAFTEAQTLLATGRSLYVATQWEVRKACVRIRSDLSRMARATYLCELTDRFVIEHEPCESVWDMLAEALRSLENDAACLDCVLHAYELRLLMERGYGPRLDGCVACGSPAERDGIAFSAASGGTLCRQCSRAARDSVRLTPAAHDLMVTLQEGGRPNGAPDPCSATLRLVGQCTRWTIRHILEREVRSLEFLDVVRRGEE